MPFNITDLAQYVASSIFYSNKTPKYDPPQCNTIRHADLYIPKVLFDPKTFVYLWKLFIWNFVLS